MALRDEVLSFMDRLMQKDQFQDYLPIGLLIEGKSDVRKVATGVSASLELFEQAAAWEADMVVVHHGMFWKSSDRVVRGHLKKRLKYLLDRDITLAGYHLPLDAHPEIGNNILAARALDLIDPQPFGDYLGRTIGYKGNLKPIAIEEFARKAMRYYEIGSIPSASDGSAKAYAVGASDSVRLFLGGKPVITSAAVISGGAWDMMPQAVHAGIDCFITGNADEPVYHLAREEEINFLAFGHHATERVGVRRLGEVLAQNFPDVETRFFDTPNPL